MESEDFNKWLVSDLKNLLLQYDITNQDIKGSGKKGNVVKKDYIKTVKKVIKTAKVIKNIEPNVINEDIWYNILLNLQYEDLKNTCLTDKNALKVCVDKKFWEDKFKHDDLIMTEQYHTIKEWLTYYKKSLDNKTPKYFIISEGGGMSSEWFTEVEFMNNKVKILAHYRLFWDDYDTWPEKNKLVVKSGNKGKIVEGEGRIAVTYKYTDSKNKSTLYEVVNPMHIFSYSSYPKLI